MTLLGIIGFFIYPPVMLLALVALDLTSKKAVGTAAGFIGMFGYLGGRSTVNLVFGRVMDYYGPLLGRAVAWEMVIRLILGATLMAIILLTFTWRIRPRA
jgi:OPA family glycerol-3-phosphate transporter-like MFS transporter